MGPSWQEHFAQALNNTEKSACRYDGECGNLYETSLR